MQHINVGLEDALLSALSWIDSNAGSLEDTSNLNTITGFAQVYELIICAH
jgi:hypothetical protein